MASTAGPPGSAPQAKGKPPNEHCGYGFGPTAPSRYLLFPVHANVTAVELLAYLPNSIHCADVVYRLITNGASPHLLWLIVNTYRDMLVEWSQNSCRQSIYETMQKAGYKNWRLKSHNSFHEERKSTWDENNLDVAGFSTSGQDDAKNTSVGNIPFKRLAVGLRREPQGYDALDLTRMVRYCMESPHEPWFYPRDYDAVLRLVGGAAPLQQEHSDREAFKRWTVVNHPPLLSASTNALLVADKRYGEDKRRGLSGTIEDTLALKRQKKSDTLPRATQSTHETPVSEGRQVREEPRGRPKRKVRIEEEQEFEEIAVSGDVMNQASQYLSATAYIAPPDDAIMPWSVATEADDGAIDLAFASRGQVGETDPYSAYAFGGPRHAPPYRQLYRIDLPDPADVSGWAENLRWAFAQNTLFRYPCRPDAWNESPEHMERIVQIRRDQNWMSEEFMAEE
jgi:hypothetical protein